MRDNTPLEQVPLIEAAYRLSNAAQHDGRGWGAGTAGAAHSLDVAKQAMRQAILDSPRPAIIASMILELEEFRREKKASGWELLTALRSNGWMVAAHSDFHREGAYSTFWLFTKDGHALKGEGTTDAEALSVVWETAKEKKL